MGDGGGVPPRRVGGTHGSRPVVLCGVSLVFPMSPSLSRVLRPHPRINPLRFWLLMGTIRAGGGKLPLGTQPHPETPLPGGLSGFWGGCSPGLVLEVLGAGMWWREQGMGAGFGASGWILGREGGFWGRFCPLGCLAAPEHGKNEKHQETFPKSDPVATPTGRVGGHRRAWGSGPGVR